MNTQFIVLSRNITVVLTFIFLILLSPQKVFAAIYINEFGSNEDPDWIEIYNSDSSSVDLSLYRLKDNTSTNKKDLSGTLNGGGYTVFDWSNKLNNSGDVIKLVFIADENNTIDQVSYGDKGGTLAPLQGQSAGRQTDGGGTWVVFNTPTKGSTNNASTPIPTATATLSPSPSSTPIPTPTRTPTPTKTPTPTATPKPQATEKPNTPTPTKSVSTNVLGSATAPKVSPSPALTEFRLTSNKNSKKDILDGASTTKSASPTSENVEVTKTQVLSETTEKPKNNTFALVSIIGGGVALLACGILLYRKYKSSEGFNPI